MQFEILAPAGSMESLIAGVRCGAHAVYLGGQTGCARRSADLNVWAALLVLAAALIRLYDLTQIQPGIALRDQLIQ